MPGDPEKNPALNFTVRVVSASSLRNQAEAEPFKQRQSQFGPVVEKTAGGMADLEKVFTFAIEFEFPPGQRTLVARGSASFVAKDSAKHRSEFPRQFFAAAEIGSDPGGTGSESFVVIAGFQMKKAMIGSDRGLSV